MKQKYTKLKNTYENFFISYAVNGPMVDPEHGLRQGMPDLYPISGPVKQPSPLNTRYKYIPRGLSITGIL